MKEMWDKRYNESDFAYGSEPNAFLVSNANKIPKGNVLCLAEGEGRNAIYLAKMGYKITAVDQSVVGLEKAKSLAKKQGVSIDIIAANLADFEIQPNYWDGIVSISAHVPPDIRKKLHRQIVEQLKPNGVLILEAFTEKQLDMEGIGGPPSAQKEMFMSLDGLKNELKGLNLSTAREVESIFNEGKYHQGPGAVVQIIAYKKNS